MMADEKHETARQFWIAAGLSLFAALAFFFSTNAKLRDLDYTSQIASALLRGHVGLTEKPPEWLNEMIPHGERYYSAFPLGAVLSMVPIALLQKARLIHDFPGRVLAALIAGSCVYFFFQLAKAFGADYSKLERTSLVRRILLPCSPFLGRGRGVISGSAERGKSLSVSRYWEKLRRSISRWCDRRLLSRERFSRWLLAIAPSCSSRYPFIFTFSGAAQAQPRSTGTILNKSFGEMGPWRSAF